MKNLIQKSEVQNSKTFANFSTVKLAKKGLKNVKGGEDIIIVDDIIQN